MFNISIHNFTCLSEVQNFFLNSQNIFNTSIHNTNKRNLSYFPTMRALPLLLVDFYCDFYQEKQRSRDRAPVLSADEYAIVLNGPVLCSHFPGNSHEQNLLHRRVCTIIEAITMHYIGGWDKTVRDRLAPRLGVVLPHMLII